MYKRIIVIGAGAAGLIAAGRAAESGAEVIVLEKNREAGKKILITGKERCNITNTAELEKFIAHYGRNGNFLRNAYHRFFREELLALLSQYGVETQAERGGRVYPTSGRASDVRDALLRYTELQDATIRYLSPVSSIFSEDGEVAGVNLQNGDRILCSSVILATGGASWSSTGSSGDGYQMAKKLGHTIVPLRPALVPLTVAERSYAKALQGISLRNVSIKFYASKGKGSEKLLRPNYPMPTTGEMLFTHFGVSGPLILTASLNAVDALRAGKKVTLSIDLKPGMTEQAIHNRLQREFEQQSHKRLRNLLRDWVPEKLAGVLAKISGVEEDRHVYQIRAVEREKLVKLFKDFRWQITDSLPMDAGMITAGGVSLKEVDPLSFESKKIKQLYLTGELLDIAADTGGFNLQAAFTSGYLAGEHAANS